MKKLAFIIFCLILMSVLAACGGSSLEDYRIYISEEAAQWEKDAAEELAEAIFHAHGVKPERVSEFSDSEDLIIIGQSGIAEKYGDIIDLEGMDENGFEIAKSGEAYLIGCTSSAGAGEGISRFVCEVINEELRLELDAAHSGTGEEDVSSDGKKHINVDIPADNGCDIYQVPSVTESGYRYGPSIMVYEDGSVDVWYASGGSGLEQWDWIAYKHSEDGVNWSEEKCVLQPTPNSLDHYSCCDPGVIYINGYYYLGYTSTLNNNQCDNNLFVARSENPDGPFEKWNGSGWGGYEPQPLVYFTEDQSYWGIGEVSFVELDGTLYIYYTVKGSDEERTEVATADATDENWPLTMKAAGVALSGGTNDSIDVKYVDEYGKFLAVATDERLSEDSYLVFFESSDGITFEKIDICKRNVYAFCHNAGISGSENGHILPGRPTFVGYAYGRGWGIWNTRFQEIDISLADSVNLSERTGPNIEAENERDTRDPDELEFVGISAQNRCVIRVPDTQTIIQLNLTACTVFHNRWTSLSKYAEEVKFYGYDESLIQRIKSTFNFRVMGKGSTMITAEFRGHLTYIYIEVYNKLTAKNVTDLKPEFSDRLCIDNTGEFSSRHQIKSIVTYGDGSWEMIWSAAESDISYEYDGSALSIDENSNIKAKRSGVHEVKVTKDGKSYVLTVEVKLPDLSKIDFAKESAFDSLTGANNTDLSLTENGKLRCETNSSTDPYFSVDYSVSGIKTEDYSSVTVKYMIPSGNELSSYSAQLFFSCDESGISEEMSERVKLKKDGRYHEIKIKLKNKDYWSGDLTSIRFDFFDECEKGDLFYIESITLNK